MKKSVSLQARFSRFMISLLFVLTIALSVSGSEEALAATTKPSKVTLSSISAPAYNKVTINWKKASNLTSYNVYYKESGASKWTKLAKVSKSKTSYTHTSSDKYKLTPGKTYYYTVRAYNSKIKKSGSYNKTGLKVVIPGKPSKVTLSSVSTSSTNKVTVKWKKASNATAYRVYYKAEGDSKWTRIATVDSSKTSYTHKSSTKYPLAEGKTYYYTVRAYNSKSKALGSYDKKGLTAKIPVKPSTPKLIKVEAIEQDEVKVTWDSVSNATEMRVYYKESNTSKWTRVATLSGSATSYTHASSIGYPLKEGKTYYYTVRGYNKNTKLLGSYDTKGLSVTITVEKEEEKKDENKVKMYTATEIQSMIDEVFRLTNEERIKFGNKPLTYLDDVQKASMIRAKEISTYFSHTRPNGKNFGTVFNEVGITGGSAENIAAGQKTSNTVVEAWMNSPGHRASIISSDNVGIGIGLYQDTSGRLYWV